ncbi:hypothetical protein MTR_3g065120 [Medicago truncatula]|uniref:Uncharacterized protein n=1 Tax=Medicago truncatula TaxID=3880 RepID=G7J8R3_MEDTR|nr:hypothetical protein MTR_3g065120 [Medicago truncatula]
MSTGHGHKSTILNGGHLSRELNSVGKDIAYYMQGPGFEPQTPHFSTIKLCEIEFVRRQTNEVAHALSREVTLLASPVVYFNLPECIETLIINEML